MQIGTKISGAAHLILIGWALFGGTFRSEPLPFDVQEVSVISAEEFAAMTATRDAPELGDQVAALQTPDVDEATDAPDVSEPDAPTRTETPENTATPEAETPPEPVEDTATPEAEVTDTAPVITPPEPETPETPAISREAALPKPVDRVAPTPVAPPPPDAKPDEVKRDEVTPDEGADSPQEPQEATAPEEATDRIVTEATETDTSEVLSSVRPQLRPQNIPEQSDPKPQPDAPSEQAAETPPARSATDDAVAAALGGTPDPKPVPSGPPLTSGEKDALRIAVQDCWVVDAGSRAAEVVVTLGLSLDRSGKVDGKVVLLNAEGGDETSVKVAFEAARRAVLRCQKDGYKLPIEKYDHWRDVEITFNPEKMRRR